MAADAAEMKADAVGLSSFSYSAAAVATEMALVLEGLHAVTADVVLSSGSS